MTSWFQTQECDIDRLLHCKVIQLGEIGMKERSWDKGDLRREQRTAVGGEGVSGNVAKAQ
jgi:hypothetical protein